MSTRLNGELGVSRGPLIYKGGRRVIKERRVSKGESARFEKGEAGLHGYSTGPDSPNQSVRHVHIMGESCRGV
jgi:hypothetical protein